MTTDQAAIDNDVLLKLSCYCLLDEVANAIGLAVSELHVLGAARYVVPKAIRRSRRIADKERAEANFARFISEVHELEPTEDEVRLATQIEEFAQINNLSLDTGESQLCAIVIVRLFSVMVTGDKRAIVGLEKARHQLPGLTAIDGRIMSLEHVVERMLHGIDADALRTRICAERLVDQALAICFSCSSPDATAYPIDGLLSYMRDLIASAPHVLCPSHGES